MSIKLLKAARAVHQATSEVVWVSCGQHDWTHGKYAVACRYCGEVESYTSHEDLVRAGVYSK